MNVTDTQKKYLYWGGGGVVVIAIIIGLVFALKSGSKKTNLSQVDVLITNPKGIRNEKTLSIDVSNMGVADFISAIVSETHFIKDITSIAWSSIIINNDSVALDTRGQISKNDPVANFTGKNPKNIAVRANYIIICSGNKPSCSPCVNGQAQGAVCDGSGNWVCGPVSACPPPSELTNCCVNNPAGPVGTCVNGVITCGQCPEDKKPDCGKPGCSLIGPVCTSTGWVCSPGKACPTQEDLKECKCPEGKNPSCHVDSSGNASIICSTCQGTPKTCDTECDMCGPVCLPDNTWGCKAGVKCPPLSSLYKCCPDPDKPVAVCPEPEKNPTEDCGSGVNMITCKGCGDKPTTPGPNGEYKECLQGGSCDGHGWVCTPNGWVCVPGVACPSAEFDMSQCCSGDRKISQCFTGPGSNNVPGPYNCVQCNCPTGESGLPANQCGGKGVCNTCCPDGTDIVQCGAGCLCCPKERANCHQMICCPDGTIHKNGECVVVCGQDTSGNPFTCDTNQSCLEIDGLSPAQKTELQNEYGSDVRIDPKNNSAFVCKTDNQSCIYTNESSIPASIDNYYPCLAFPDASDSNIAYCTSDTGSNISTCFNSYKNKDECNNDKNCTWRDVLEYIGENKSIDQSVENIITDINNIQGKSGGYYCDSENGKISYSRVIAYGSSGCDWDSCWSRMAQPGIIDVKYNTETGNCIALQSCSDPTAGLNSYNTGQDGNKVPNPDRVNIFKNGNSSFPECKGSSCPIPSSDKSVKCGQNGKLYLNCDTCSDNQLCVETGKCRCVDPSGNILEGIGGRKCNTKMGTITTSDNYMGIPSTPSKNYGVVGFSPVNSLDFKWTRSTDETKTNPTCLFKDNTKCLGSGGSSGQNLCITGYDTSGYPCQKVNMNMPSGASNYSGNVNSLGGEGTLFMLSDNSGYWSNSLTSPLTQSWSLNKNLTQDDYDYLNQNYD
jgi:hypothetical protein